LPLKIVDNKRRWDEIKKMAQMNKPDVLFIDFIQNIKVDGNNIYEKMSELAVEIQSLAIDNNIAIIDISQMSNE
jgi:predicted ATP-dependent serine protease